MLKAKYINPFLEAVYDLFETMLSAKAKRTGAALSRMEKKSETVMALIGLSGQARGSVAMQFPTMTAIAMVSRLLMVDINEEDENVADAVSELVNIVAGNAKAKLSESVGETLELSLPTVLRGEEYEVMFPSQALWLEVPFSSDLGRFSMLISFQFDGGA